MKKHQKYEAFAHIHTEDWGEPVLNLWATPEVAALVGSQPWSRQCGSGASGRVIFRLDPRFDVVGALNALLREEDVIAAKIVESELKATYHQWFETDTT